MTGLLIIGAIAILLLSVKSRVGEVLTERREEKLPFPNWTEYDGLFRKYAVQYSVDWQWLKAIAINESSLGNNSLVKAGLASTDGKSYGLMQVTIETGIWLAGGPVNAEYLNSPENSVRLAAKYVGYLAALFPGDRKKIIMSYNQGQGNTLKGKTYALPYFERWERNLKKVEDFQ